MTISRHVAAPRIKEKRLLLISFLLLLLSHNLRTRYVVSTTHDAPDDTSLAHRIAKPVLGMRVTKVVDCGSVDKVALAPNANSEITRVPGHSKLALSTRKLRDRFFLLFFASRGL
jgi:hypothetical protein